MPNQLLALKTLFWVSERVNPLCELMHSLAPFEHVVITGTTACKRLQATIGEGIIGSR